jgi:signal transduction histidine kinase
MLEEFILANRDIIIAQAQARFALRTPSTVSGPVLTDGVPVFLEQLGDVLRMSKRGGVIDHTQIGLTAARHGHDLLRKGLSIGQVVHEYGDVCQTITELALEKKAPLSGEDFKTLNLCLDDAIAGAVTEYSRQREHSLAARGTERLGILAHELRRTLNTAMLSFESIRGGRVALAGATGILHAHSMLDLRDLIDRSLAEVRLEVGLGRLEPMSVTELIREVEIGAPVRAEARDIDFVVTTLGPEVTVEGDRESLTSAISNLLDNAFKSTRVHGNVSLAVRADQERVLIEVADECGGLPPGKAEDLSRAFAQRSDDRSSLGLGLGICARAAKENGGEVRVQDVPHKGCIFTLDLPRKPAQVL